MTSHNDQDCIPAYQIANKSTDQSNTYTTLLNIQVTSQSSQSTIFSPIALRSRHTFAVTKKCHRGIRKHA